MEPHRIPPANPDCNRRELDAASRQRLGRLTGNLPDIPDIKADQRSASWSRQCDRKFGTEPAVENGQPLDDSAKGGRGRKAERTDALFKRQDHSAEQAAKSDRTEAHTFKRTTVMS